MNNRYFIFFVLSATLCCNAVLAQEKRAQNPVIHADVPDMAMILSIPVIAVFLISKPSRETAPILIPIILSTFVFVLWNMVKKQKRAWETFELIIGENDIKRHQEGFPSIVIPKGSIEKAVIAKNGAITLIANPKSSSIIVPFSVMNREELLKEVSTQM